jgi:hypothetical protein
MHFKKIFNFIPYILFSINIAMPAKCMADANFDTLLNQPFHIECQWTVDAGVYFANVNQVVKKIYFWKGDVVGTSVLGRSVARGNTLSYQFTNDTGNKGTETIELVNGGYRLMERVLDGVVLTKNGKNLRENSNTIANVSCPPNTMLFGDYEKTVSHVAKFDALRATGYLETNIVDVIVGFDEYIGKKVFLKCWINSMDSSGGSCSTEDDEHYVYMGTKGIDKKFFRWILGNCRAGFEQITSYSECRALWITATVGGSTVPRLENLRPVD